MTVLDALQTTLAGEHAALYTYGVLGARTSQALEPVLYDALTAGYRRHRARRDHLRLLVIDAGGTPVAAEVAYALDGSLLRAPQVQRAARDLEDASVEVLTSLVARSTGEVRAWALTEAIWSATWQVELVGVPVTWPGAPELA